MISGSQTLKNADSVIWKYYSYLDEVLVCNICKPLWCLRNSGNRNLTMAKPTSAFFSAGPSLVPSPVTATISRVGLSLLSMMPLTRVYLSWGEDRANTRKLGHTSSNFFWLTCTVKHVHMYKLCFKNLDGSRPFSIIHHILVALSKMGKTTVADKKINCKV